MRESQVPSPKSLVLSDEERAGHALPAPDGQWSESEVACRDGVQACPRHLNPPSPITSSLDYQVELLSMPWTIFYLASAILISFFYYHNPGWWKLLEHTRYWLNWIYSFL